VLSGYASNCNVVSLIYVSTVTENSNWKSIRVNEAETIGSETMKARGREPSQLCKVTVNSKTLFLFETRKEQRQEKSNLVVHVQYGTDVASLGCQKQ
jgi:hypothetical protein